MEILVADDSRVSRRILQTLLNKWGYDVVFAVDGREALEALERPDSPKLVLLDWVMPAMDGDEVCKKVRETSTMQPPYIILVTARGEKENLVHGLEAGANDYVTKPFDNEELRARIEVGRRVVELQAALAKRVEELEEAAQQIRTLENILPICSYCKKIRDDKAYWEHLESYLSRYSGVQFSHSICPDCYEKHVRPQIEELEASMDAARTPSEPDEPIRRDP